MATRLVPYLSYEDASAAIVWLEAIGFMVVARQDSDDGGVAHAELRLNDVVVMVASNDEPYTVPPLEGKSTGSGMYLVVDDVDRSYVGAIEAGGKSVFPPENTEWGTRRARVLDPGGREWSFGTYEPGATW